ncbi:hypothetical protein AQUCO_00700921v1 [Aquilegia coerulea]|uniref:DOG1 domain-containing protein n=1 Tax=Aquilegia coerulea TaxID=218851 RepID=A0A2G5EMW1_AQUCA|nr:hypothetical protein AQUCO_00700921v1 [Aquilegia coerulea]
MTNKNIEKFFFPSCFFFGLPSLTTLKKVLRRLAQNREAARKSRLRKKAYVQQLETSRLKLTQIEQELDRARQQGMYISGALDTNHLGVSGTVNPGVAAFEMEHGHWSCAYWLHNGMNHYYKLFQMKEICAKSDVFYLMSGMWRTSSERFFLWLGGFRPSELLRVLRPQLDTLTEQQTFDVCTLQHSSRQAEDALSQGMDQFQLTRSICCRRLHADNLREQALQQMSHILTTRQAARGLLALGDYFQRLRALSKVWAARPCEPA